jgi:hypothetical protein
MMIRRNTDIIDNIFELRRHESIDEYSRTYGDELARRYEDLSILYIPYFPLDIDLEFFQSLTFPAEFKKVGTTNGIEKSLVVREGSNLMVDQSHVLLKIFPDAMVALYAQNQIATVNAQIRNGLRALFPKYYSLRQSNITWRLTTTIGEGLHVDGFLNGKPTPPEVKGRYQRVKLFINIDSEPRRWWTSYPLPELLKRYRHQFPGGLPDDADMVTYQISGKPWLLDAPHHEIDFPTLAAVTGESQGIPHAIVYGRRMIAAEFFCETRDMLDPRKNVQASLKRWITDAGISLKEINSFLA